MIRLAVLLCLVFAAPAWALESTPAQSSRATVTLVTDSDTAGAPFHAGLRLRLAPGWHTYWQNPGDAGVAPDVAWTLPPGVTAGPIAWPAPERLAEGPLTTFAYTGEVLLPVAITGTGPLSLQAHASWLVCQQICVPEEADFRLDLPAGPPTASAQAPLFAAAQARLPRPSPFAATIASDGRLTLAGDGLSSATVASASFFPLDAAALNIDAPQTTSVREGAVTVALAPAATFDPHATLGGVLVLRDPKGGETALDVVAAPGGTAAGPGLATLLAFALAGGLILNLMPCVFPILAMKAVALSRLSGAGRGVVRAEAGAYTAGVVLSFVALGGLLLALRAGGSVAGWGFQFQSPLFVVGMAWLLFAVGLNLVGVFEVTAGSVGVARRSGWTGSFLTGMLAVVVATPCTAPFMGVAIAGALAAPAAATIAVFAAMGFGLALPYALLAAVPSLARALPRPGAWMDTLKQVLAFPMFAAAAWLAWVASQEAGPPAVLAALAGTVLLGLAAWAFGRAQTVSGPGRRVGQAVALAAVLATAALLTGVSGEPTPGPAPPGASADSEPFTPARLAALRADGHPVFVNMTAAWCVSCLVNERVALSPANVRAAFAAHGVTTLKGDWTRQDPAISAFLRAHDRDGVPLYIFYAPGRGGVVLPQILTAGTVLAALDG